MKRVSVNIQEKFIEFIDNLVDLGLVPSRNEFIRSSIEDGIQKKTVFLSNFNSSVQKLQEYHKKYVEFNEQLKRDILNDAFPLEKKVL